MTGSDEAPKVWIPRRTAENDKYHNFKDCEGCGERKRLADFHYANDWRKKRAANPKRYKKRCAACSRVPAATRVDPDFKPDRAKPGPKPKKLTAQQSRDNRAASKRRVRRHSRIKALEYLASHGCSDCGDRDPRILEFDHIDPADKSVPIVKLLSDGYSWGAERLRAEIRKCRVICANCHRKHTIIQQGYYAHDDVQEALREIYDRYGISVES